MDLYLEKCQIFKAKMHQVRFLLGSLQRSPDPLAVLRGILLRKGRGTGRGGGGKAMGGEGVRRAPHFVLA